MAKFGELARDAGMEMRTPGADAPSPSSPEIGLPDDQITTWVDVTAFADRKFAALGAHASQEETMPFLSLGVERFARVHGRRDLRPGRRHARHRRPGDRPVRRSALNAGPGRGRTIAPRVGSARQGDGSWPRCHAEWAPEGSAEV